MKLKINKTYHELQHDGMTYCIHKMYLQIYFSKYNLPLKMV